MPNIEMLETREIVAGPRDQLDVFQANRRPPGRPKSKQEA